MPKILLADDSTHAQRMGTKILSAEGMEVVTVSNGEAAAKKLPGGNFDVVLADVFMPGRSGYELCAYIKNTAKFAHIPVVLVVGQLEPFDPDQGKKARADGLLKKPFTPTEVVKTVRAMLELAEQRRPAPEPPPVQDIAAVEEHHDVGEIPPPSQAAPRFDVPSDMQQQSAFGLYEETPAAQAPAAPAVPAAPAAPAAVAEATGSAYGVAAEPAPSAQTTPAPAPAAAASVYGAGTEIQAGYAAEPAPIPEPALIAPVVDYTTPAEAADDVSIPGLLAPEAEEEAAAVVAAPPVPESEELVAAVAARQPARHWVAEAEAVTDMDRAAFSGAAWPAAAAAAAAVAPAVAAEPAPVPDWADLLKSVEEPVPAAPFDLPPSAPELEAAAPAAEPAPVVAQAEAAVAEPAPAAEEAPAAVAETVPEAVAAAPAVAEAAPAIPEAAEAPAVPEAAEAPEAAAVAAAPAAPISDEVIRAAIEAGLDNAAMPGLRAVPGLVDALTAEVLRRLTEGS